MANDEEQQWKQQMYEACVADPRIQALTMEIAESITRDGGPKITFADTAAARRYLRKCVLNMSASEISQLRIADVAGLWARGAAGAAQWRLRGSHAAGGGEQAARQTQRRHLRKSSC